MVVPGSSTRSSSPSLRISPVSHASHFSLWARADSTCAASARGRSCPCAACAQGYTRGYLRYLAKNLNEGYVASRDLRNYADALEITELAERAGLATDNGLLVDAALRTSDPAIYAIGDIANHDHPVLGRRVRKPGSAPVEGGTRPVSCEVLVERPHLRAVAGGDHDRPRLRRRDLC